MLGKRVLVAADPASDWAGADLAWGSGIRSDGALILGLAAWEYVGLFRAGGLQPAGILVVLGTLGLAAGRAYSGFDSAPWMISLVVLLSMTYHLVAYERGRDQAGTDFGITLAGVLYIGWIGSYLISLRELPEGVWWVLLALPAVWLADSGAYFIGRAFGRRKLSPRLSPKKTWEGYLGGVLVGVLGSALAGVSLVVLDGSGFAYHPAQRSFDGAGAEHHHPAG